LLAAPQRRIETPNAGPVELDNVHSKAHRQTNYASFVKVSGISMLRNEADVVQLCLLHHLAIGCDNVLVVDNGSTDGTVAILRRLAHRYPILWTRDDGPYRQSEIITGLARDAACDGADWIVPFDADEFWWMRSGSLRKSLERR
jgi:cellulose synthase/poly-beta-1,6-N-acetylglucosamine synthase-like glycosyltransferase